MTARPGAHRTAAGGPSFRCLVGKRWNIRQGAAAFLALALAGISVTHAQTPTQTQNQPQTQETPPPNGTVLFERTTPLDPDAPAPPPALPQPTSSLPKALEPGDEDPLHISDAEREALTFTAYDLDTHLTPASAGISVHANLTLRNDGPAPLARLVLQISCTLRWDAVSSAGTPLAFTARRLATDTDHTGYVTEAVISLPQPLAPGASIALTTLYSGTIAPSAERLERIGAPADQALASDWDTIAPSGTALRGFGNVLWYPVAAPPLFLGDGAKLFQATGRTRLREATATVRLRLVVEYIGDPPDAAFFCGRREHLAALSDNADVPVAEAPGVAIATFAPHPLGFRTLSLFITDHPPTQVDPTPTLTQAPPDVGLLAAVTDRYDALPSYAAAAGLVEPLLTDWLGPQPHTALNLLDHPGQPFEDDTLLVRPLRTEDPKALAPALAHSLTHAWLSSSHIWIDEGLAQFLTLLWTERTAGHAAALAQLQEAASGLAFIEPAAGTPEGPTSTAAESSSSSSQPPSPSGPGQSLIDATADIYYRSKAAAVFWQLRGILGDDVLKQGLQAYRADPSLDRDPTGLQRILEKVSHKDLRWFFNDWVYNDRGLPDLTIVNVTPRQLEARNGLPAGWLVSIEVRNDGDAVADVPFTLRGLASSTEAQRLRIPAHGSVSTRIVFAGTPTEVQVNDGSVPETRTSTHTRALVMPAAH